jgi:gluconate 2-dehydrogenase subunit 3-like protein
MTGSERTIHEITRNRANTKQRSATLKGGAVSALRLSSQQQQTLRAAVDRIIPPDDYPGAWESGVGDYLERQFEKDLRPMLDNYRAGLTSLEAESIERFQQGFSLISDDERDIVLSCIEAGEVLTVWEVEPRFFFDLLVNTTAEGFYSNPEQGGNRNAVSWAMTGFEEALPTD